MPKFPFCIFVILYFMHCGIFITFRQNVIDFEYDLRCSLDHSQIILENVINRFYSLSAAVMNVKPKTEAF